MMTLHVIDKRWNAKRIKSLAEKVFKQTTPAGRKRSAKTRMKDIIIILSNDSEIRKLNKQFRKLDKPTNVLSFESTGDIIISLDTLEREAREQGKKFRDHFAHILLHGLLHLNGYDHKTDAQATKMERKEIEILKTLEISDPYL
ncbi:MAG: rRNA maturation RNase YbeY [Alphaproteobacteria bacterium]|nr:rRNA maturation RNase YbeY [Alphaproteobacteria bacterium]